MPVLMSGVRIISPGPHHHPGLLERVVPEPELPDDAAIVTIVLRLVKIFSIQVRLKTTGMNRVIDVQLVLRRAVTCRTTTLRHKLEHRGSTWEHGHCSYQLLRTCIHCELTNCHSHCQSSLQPRCDSLLPRCQPCQYCHDVI